MTRHRGVEASKKGASPGMRAVLEAGEVYFENAVKVSEHLKSEHTL